MVLHYCSKVHPPIYVTYQKIWFVIIKVHPPIYISKYGLSYYAMILGFCQKLVIPINCVHTCTTKGYDWHLLPLNGYSEIPLRNIYIIQPALSIFLSFSFGKEVYRAMKHGIQVNCPSPSLAQSHGPCSLTHEFGPQDYP